MSWLSIDTSETDSRTGVEEETARSHVDADPALASILTRVTGSFKVTLSVDQLEARVALSADSASVGFGAVVGSLVADPLDADLVSLAGGVRKSATASVVL